MFFSIALILAPLFIGYSVEVKRPRLLQLINASLSKLVYVILALMGYNLAFIDNLASNFTRLILICSVFISIITFFNLAGLFLFRRHFHWSKEITEVGTFQLNPGMFKDSASMVLIVAVGFTLGFLGHWTLPYQSQLSDYVLMFLLALIGLQLRASELTLRQVFLDRRGMLIAVIVFVSTLPAALLAGWLLDIPKPLALALSSGFGWYSLSGILISGQVNALMGSSAFFIDLLRELIAIVLIPLLMPISKSAAIGYGGATSMDFTLPIIARSGGTQCVPVAIVSGFLLSLACPALIAIWLSIYISG
ncbi:LysO family transporter [Celerinatantimonas diazotrophica]|uniref:Uncharacterized membrane protein YbjE (DUF340 family) n=1 Tax=Celerinatantimonas diazotrophica TaxID=412034 RepID=A0A4R1J8N2_9GAMM|nr:lysine exporter LysO family protein [Celerinatantimonas diazotrophica]TCK46952.1 uncharacterized membrane protein YbjE (DUF340 family) [Celerinatantimonas diazotrophica]CAG9295720.1 Lysine exporter LysO [Celerinatantimonas diazotrophica]